jgi:hypothetical protein
VNKVVTEGEEQKRKAMAGISVILRVMILLPNNSDVENDDDE